MPLNLPADQSFEVVPWLGTPGGGATHPAFVWQYLAFDPWGHISSGTYPTGVGRGFLSTYHPSGFKGATCSDLLSSAVGDTSMRCFAATWAPSVDCIVRASFARSTTNSSTGSSVPGGFRGGAIFNRIGGTYGTVQSAGTPNFENAEYADCYALWVHPLSTAPNADLWFHVFAITHSSASGSSGTLRELAVHKITGGMALLDPAAPIDVSFEVETNGSDVDLTARVHVMLGGGNKQAITLFATTLIGGTVTLGTDVTASAGGVLTDANAGKITSGNGVGWGMYTTRTDTVGATGVDVVEGITNFRVANASSNAVLYEDDFTRVGQGEFDAPANAVFRTCTDALGNAGKWLNSGWAYGATAATDNTASDVDPLLGQTESGTTSFDGTDYLTVKTSQTVPSGAEPLEREFFSTRPADYDYSQHRSLEFKPFDHQVSEPNWGASVDKYGILLRATVQNGGVSTCFAAWAQPTFIDSGGLTQSALSVRFGLRVDTGISGPATYITMWSKDVAGVDLVDGSWHKIEYDMHVIESSPDTNGPVIHEVKLDGSTVVFDTPGTFTEGQNVLGDGRVVDSGAFGPGSKSFVEGFFLESTTAETDLSSNVLRYGAQVRNWTQETLTVLESTTSPEQMGNFALAPADEVNTAASGDIGTVLDVTFPVDVALTSSSPVKHQGAKGHDYHRNRATRSRYLFRFETAPLDESGRAALLAFWSARKRSVSFTFDLTHDRSFTVYFAEPPRFHFDAPKAWRASISLIERLS